MKPGTTSRRIPAKNAERDLPRAVTRGNGKKLRRWTLQQRQLLEYEDALR